MNNKVNFDTSNKSFSEIIGNGKRYTVPKYQRDYSWDREQWEDLWADILEINDLPKEEREEHYMGYLVLQRSDIDKFKIIDGQQRMTTLSLLILAALQILQESEEEFDEKRLELLKHKFISTQSASSLREEFKLELNRNCDAYYRNDLASLTKSPRKRSIKRTEHQLRKAKEYFERELRALKMNGEELGSLIENIVSNYLLFTVITVGDDVNAYKVFETLNARGVQLSTPDLLKNYIFSIIDPRYEDVELIERQEELWSQVLDDLGSEDFSTFLRIFWNSRNTLVTKTRLYKAIKGKTSTPEMGVTLLKDLAESSPIYAALRNHEDELWRDISDSQAKRRIKDCLYMLRTFNIVLPYGILLNARLKLNDCDFGKVCKYVTAFCVRYHVICNRASKDIEQAYSKMAQQIMLFGLNGFREKLLQFMPIDNDFITHFSDKTLTTTQSMKKAAYLLGTIENSYNTSNQSSLPNPHWTVEHILPKKAHNSEASWRKAFGDLLEQQIHRIGNLTLLSAADNMEVDGKPFDQKKTVFEKSGIKLSEIVARYETWDTATLSDHQKKLALKAAQIWSF